MIKRHFTADSINVVINHPSVYEWGRGSATGKIDLSVAVENKNNVLLMGDYGGVMFMKHQPGLYEAHSQVLPSGRGTWMLDATRECVEWMFTHTDCMDIITRVPKGNLGARTLARAVGLTPEYRLERGWIMDGQVVYADVFSIQIQKWMATAPGLESKGEEFHNHLEKEYSKLGKEGPSHGHDPVHDRYVGATWEMVKNGQAVKAMIMYNRWAGMAGYAPIQIASLDPVIIDIQESLLQVPERGDFFVLRMR